MPATTPDAQNQYNFTDPESRIMKAGSGAHFEQSYNAQAAVEVEGSMLVLGAYVTDAPNDKEQLVRTASGRATYKKRKETVEPVFGIIKSVMGCRRFLLRGMRKVALEWSLVTLAYNFRRLARLVAAVTTRPAFERVAQAA